MNSFLPPVPTTVNATSVMARMVDAIALRFNLSTLGLLDKNLSFRPVESSLSIGEVIEHIYDLLAWINKCLGNDYKTQLTPTVIGYRIAIEEVCEQLKTTLMAMKEEELEAIQIYLKRTDTHYPFWNLINGPMSDVLTHVGQINSWRRMDGNPCPKYSPFTGEPY